MFSQVSVNFLVCTCVMWRALLWIGLKGFWHFGGLLWDVWWGQELEQRCQFYSPTFDKRFFVFLKWLASLYMWIEHSFLPQMTTRPLSFCLSWRLTIFGWGFVISLSVYTSPASSSLSHHLFLETLVVKWIMYELGCAVVFGENSKTCIHILIHRLWPRLC